MHPVGNSTTSLQPGQVAPCVPSPFISCKIKIHFQLSRPFQSQELVLPAVGKLNFTDMSLLTISVLKLVVKLVCLPQLQIGLYNDHSKVSLRCQHGPSSPEPI